MKKNNKERNTPRVARNDEFFVKSNHQICFTNLDLDFCIFDILKLKN